LNRCPGKFTKRCLSKKPYMMWRLEDRGYKDVPWFYKLLGNVKIFCAFVEYFVKMNLDKELICIWVGLDLSKNILCYRNLH